MADEFDLNGDVAVETTPVVSIPPLPETVDNWDEYSDSLPSLRGVPTLKRVMKNYVYHQRLMLRSFTQAQAVHARINGFRTPREKKGDQKKSVVFAARRFFGALSTSALRQQCDLNGISYDSYESQEEIIEALVNKTTQV